MTLDEFREGLRNPEPEIRAYLVGKPKSAREQPKE